MGFGAEGFALADVAGSFLINPGIFGQCIEAVIGRGAVGQADVNLRKIRQGVIRIIINRFAVPKISQRRKIGIQLEFYMIAGQKLGQLVIAVFLADLITGNEFKSGRVDVGKTAGNGQMAIVIGVRIRRRLFAGQINLSPVRYFPLLPGAQHGFFHIFLL